MTDYNRATKAIIKSFEQFTSAFGELNKQLEEDQSEKLGKMMIAYTDLYREVMAKNDVIRHFLGKSNKS